MREACRQMHTWQKTFPLNEPLFVTVNLSSKQFSQNTLISTFAMILQETGVKPQTVKLEITESVVMENIDTADRKSTRLNSSHANISYAVFCLKKKKHKARSKGPRKT